MPDDGALFIPGNSVDDCGERAAVFLAIVEPMFEQPPVGGEHEYVVDAEGCRAWVEAPR